MQSSETFFNAVYDTYHRSVHAYLLGRTGDPEVAVDLLQDVFLRVWRNLDLLRARDGDRRRYWIFTVARNLITDHYRTGAARTRTVEQLAGRAEAGSPAPPEKEVEAREAARALHRAIERLPEDLRTVLLLQVLGDLTSAEVGQVLGKPAGTVRYQTHLARRRLAEELQLIEGDRMEACRGR